MADIMTRWLVGYKPKKSSARRVSQLILNTNVFTPHLGQELHALSRESIIEVQGKYTCLRPKDSITQDSIIRTKNNFV